MRFPPIYLIANKCVIDTKYIGRDTIITALCASLKGIDTTHAVSNPRVSIHGDSATLEAIVQAQHVPQHDHARHYMMTNRYDVELVRQEQAWVIQRVTVDNVWRTGDPGVLAGV